MIRCLDKDLGSSKNFKISFKNIWSIRNKVLLLHTQIGTENDRKCRYRKKRERRDH